MTRYTFCQNLNSVRAGTCLFMSCTLCPEQCLAHSRSLVITYYMNDFYCHSTTLSLGYKTIYFTVQREKRLRLSAWVSLVAQMVKNLPAMQETRVWTLAREDPLEKGMASHASILAWRIPWTEKPARLQSMVSQRVRHYWRTTTFQTKTKCIAYNVSHVLGKFGY